MSSSSSTALSQPAPRPKRRRWVRVLLAVLLVLVLVASSAVGAGHWLLRQSLPVTQGELTVNGLAAPVTVWRNDYGVPHIEAESDADLFFAQGYVTAQDRLFQMDLSRRQASGELSEVVGAKALERDKFFRTFGLRRAAVASWDSYSPEAKRVLEAYAAGVNAFMEEAIANKTLPVEFKLLGYEPKPWTPTDSLTIGKYMAFDLGGHWESQVFRYYLVQNFSEQKALDLFPTYPKDAPTILPAVKETKLALGDSFDEAVIPNEFNGSNNWVIAGSLTESGKPILADDPHLGLATPAIWYETHLKSDQTNVSGVIFAGVPGIILGRNEHVAWGVTNVGPDVQDVYIEKRNPANPNEFEYNGKWVPAQVIEEEIQVKDGDPVPYQITVTRHGPVISEFAHHDKPETALALKWTALQPSTELEAVLDFAKAKDWEEFKKALTAFHTPAQNFVFASTDGTIAYRANGLIPIRKKGDSSMPVPGWTDEYEWTGFIPWDELPTSVNPEQGYIATANNKVTPDDYPYHISNLWAQPYREQRIVSFIEEATKKGKIDVESVKQLQHDATNLQADELLPLLLRQLELVPADSLRLIDLEAKQMLKRWKYGESSIRPPWDDPEQAGPLLFNLWMTQLADEIFLPEIDADLYKMFEGRGNTVDGMIRDAADGKESIWLKEKGGLSRVALASFQKTVDKVVALQGGNTKKWNWGDFHQVKFQHPLASVEPLDLLFNPKPIAVGGSKVTVGAAGYNAITGEVNHGASWRTVNDLSDLTRTHNVVGPGQSGHVLSPWYDDQTKDWAYGGYHITSTRPDEYQSSEHKLVLKPSTP